MTYISATMLLNSSIQTVLQREIRNRSGERNQLKQRRDHFERSKSRGLIRKIREEASMAALSDFAVKQGRTSWYLDASHDENLRRSGRSSDRVAPLRLGICTNQAEVFFWTSKEQRVVLAFDE